MKTHIPLSRGQINAALLGAVNRNPIHGPDLYEVWAMDEDGADWRIGYPARLEAGRLKVHRWVGLPFMRRTWFRPVAVSIRQRVVESKS